MQTLLGEPMSMYEDTDVMKGDDAIHLCTKKLRNWGRALLPMHYIQLKSCCLHGAGSKLKQREKGWEFILRRHCGYNFQITALEKLRGT